MPESVRPRRVAALLAVLMLVTAACGSGEGQQVSADSTSPSSSTTAPESSTTTTPPPTQPEIATMPGMPPVIDPANIYSQTGANQLAPATNGARFLVYVPNEASSNLTVIDPRTYTVVATWPMRTLPQHVVPSYDMSRLWVLNNEGDSVTPVDPLTGVPGTPIHVEDPYNLYYLPDGSEAIIVEEANRRLTFTDPNTFAVHGSAPLDCNGFNHMDFSRDGRFIIGSCEFDGQILKIDTATRQVTGRFTIDLGAAGGSVQPGFTRPQPQDVRLSSDGKVFYVADIAANGVFVVDAESFTQIGFIPTGTGAHGLYPSRDGRQLYVVNRGVSFIPAVNSYRRKAQGSISVIDFATRTVVGRWEMPEGGSPDMGALTPDGNELWMGGRYDAEVYVFDTRSGQLIRRIPAGMNPHGLTVWPQPGRYSFGHTGNVR